jgi:pilus assembly protein Flp/PilA
MRRLFHRFIDDQSGVTAIEYSLIAALISIVIIASVRIIGTTIRPYSLGLSPLLFSGTGPASA